MKRSPRGRRPWADHYTHKARKENYVARSVYKLQEIQQRFKVLKRGQRVLDLGCAPGSWLQFASATVGSKGFVMGLDLQPVNLGRLPGVDSNVARTMVADIRALDEDALETIGRGYDLVMSDMAPATTGQKHVDAARSLTLCELALETACRVLRPGGHFVTKIFQGADHSSFSAAVARKFRRREHLKPRSTRKASKELFVVGLGFRSGGTHGRS
ncbi:MAG: RlmE family RNA methyltransferase [Desulfosarcinaceae bacterium]|nr:RlmE family RNA methyltransferase [Desulfosarcinaceae bacterium]